VKPPYSPCSFTVDHAARHRPRRSPSTAPLAVDRCCSPSIARPRLTLEEIQPPKISSWSLQRETMSISPTSPPVSTGTLSRRRTNQIDRRRRCANLADERCAADQDVQAGVTRGTERHRPRRAARIVSYVRGDGGVRWSVALPPSPAAASHQPPSPMLLYGRRLLGCARRRKAVRTEGLVQETSIFFMRSPQGTTQCYSKVMAPEKSWWRVNNVGADVLVRGE
jgi:hypothetical protein